MASNLLFSCFVLAILWPLIVEACRDYNAYCRSWATQGYCRSNAAYMQTNCRLSCNLCGGPRGTRCVDLNASCRYWQSIGECTRNPRFMLVSCKKSCGVCPRSAVWANWSAWSPCSRSCGDGTRQRSRTCSGGANQCSGTSMEKQKCNERACISQWGLWGKWGQCTKECGQGEMSRHRSCKGSLKTCRGEDKETKPCNTQPCSQPGPPGTTASTLTCGKRKINPLMGRVVGGVNAIEGSWPWQVGIFHYAGGKFPFCGGTLISPIAVLTAAHCFQNERKIMVRIGDYDLENKERYEKSVSVAKIIKHENYDDALKKNDIAVIILSEAVSFGSSVNAACLPDTNEIFSSTCFITGWGRLKQDGIQPTILQQASVPLVSHKVCNKSYKGRILPNMICAGYAKGGIDACQGDSGGPLVCPRKDGSFVVLGVTSWGYGCAKENFYGVYADTRKYRKWISKSMASIPPPTF